MAATSTRERRSEVEALEAEITELMQDVERYRTACEDTLQQLDWCIGYFTGCNKTGVAKALSANRSAIRRNILHRGEQALPVRNKESR
ncbi:MAG: hypothetical protein JF565_01860 [Propionibacteriales bacterium]|nr:hypothetical protein [Propionibacteriales bacterium]